MIKYILIIVLLISSELVSAQVLKTGVLVAGNSPAGVAAAIQSARSGAKTTLLSQSVTPDIKFTEADLPYLLNIKNYYLSKAPDSIRSRADTVLKLQEAGTLIKGILDTVKNLTFINSSISKIEKDGKGWEIRLGNGRKVKSDVVVDATTDLRIAAFLNINTAKPLVAATTNNLFEGKPFRSSVALTNARSGDQASYLTPVPLGSMIPADTENFVFIPKPTDGIVEMSAGQAAGTIAAYCAFFKTTTKNINVRIVQGELLAFGARLLPFSDISRNDPNSLAFQRVGLSGLMKPTLVEEGNTVELRFDTVSVLKSEDLRLPMKEFYSRSQIWFADNKTDTMTIENAISLLMFTAARGEELKAEIKEAWNTSFKLSSTFDPKRAITRKEFAILADRYLQPFNVRIDLWGNLLS